MSRYHLIAITCLACWAFPAHAGIITFDPNTIMPGRGGTVESRNCHLACSPFFGPPPKGVAAIAGPANNVQVPWNDSKVKMNVAAGNMHTLNMFTSLTWVPAAVGDMLTITGSYTVTASAEAVVGGVPEPSSFVLGAIGAFSVIFLSMFHSRVGHAR